ncbi:MAG: hypothetical protein ACR2IF_07825 [Terriglobales bacterium]
MTPEIQPSGVIVLVIFVAVLAERGWQWMRRRAARAWPTAEGRVERAEYRQPNTGTNRYFVADLAYSYVIRGQYYAGYYRRSFSSAPAAAEFVARMQSAPIEVRYKSSDCATSLLLEEKVAEAVGASAGEIAS